MRDGIARFGWVRYLLVAIAYAACYAMLRSVSVSNWNLPASLRLACLLLLPYRYWPALMLGEAIPVGYQAWSSHELYGLAWATFAAFPPIVLCAPVVAWFRRHTRILQIDGRIDLALLLASALVCAVLTAIGNSFALTSVQMSNGAPAPVLTVQIVFGYFLGNYLGALTLTPVVFAVRGWMRGEFALSQVLRSGFLRDVAMGLLPALAMLTWLGSIGTHDTMQVCRIFMFLPVAWLAWRHGWQGAAIGGGIASCAVAFTSTVVRDPSVIQAQAVIAFAISTLLMFGSRIAQPAPQGEEKRERGDREHGLLLAQQGLYQEELRMRNAAEALENVSQSMRDMQNRVLERLRTLLPNEAANEERAYSRQAALAQHEMHRLTNALYPRVWREQGEPSPLQEGPVALAVAAIGADFHCRLLGEEALKHLASDVHMTLYRLAGESLVHALSLQPTRDVNLVVRGGHNQGHRWVVMRMDCHRAAASDGGTRLAQEQWKKAMSLLGTSGQGIDTIRERAQIYGGGAHVRESASGLRITILLHDALRSTRHSAVGPEPPRATAH
ncbi:Signal transduction histidine kinase, glucose-6-phosphate specific [Dyella sp. OK004]|uniref:MASE1 domain-containing protein n=1 Tax=Dyella sp. OK004 TaxID=1855292 RepID=UPI0008E0B32A|nr:MASE1 domain-containing protein [Dyella sp. OK004]SFS14501.1 Signal transduction histidine kinase, glucose-6-phosphate specific [Dyella sp. OK004]